MEDLEPQLKEVLVKTFPEFRNIQVSNLVCLNSGWESVIYTFQVEYDGPANRLRKGLALRIYPGESASQKARDEYRALSILSQLDYPVPQVYQLDPDGSYLGKPFLLMDLVEGSTLWEPLFHGPKKRRPELLRQFCHLFLRLHRLDWQPYLPDEASLVGDPYLYLRQQLEGGQQMLNALGLVEFQPLLDWLNVRLVDVPCTHPAIIHYDFHPQNILLRPDGEMVVIDWTGAAISDPRVDLAWSLLLIESYEGSQWRDAVMAEYEHQAGGPLPGMDIFDVLACGRRLASVAGSIHLGAGALGMRPGAEQVMRKQLGPLRRVADRLRRITGLTPIDVDRL